MDFCVFLRAVLLIGLIACSGCNSSNKLSLSLEHKLEIPMAPGQVQLIQVTTPGFYMGTALQKGVDVALTLYPEDREPLKVDGFSNCLGAEYFFIQLSRPGSIRLEAIGSVAGSLEIWLEPASPAEYQAFLANLAANPQGPDPNLAGLDQVALTWRTLDRPRLAAIAELAAAVLLHRNRQFELALPRFEALLPQFLELEDRPRALTTLIEIARVYLRTDRVDEARRVLAQGLNLSQSGQDSWLRASLFYELAQLEYRTGSPQLALVAVQSALTIFTTLKDLTHQASSLDLMIRCLFLSGRFDEARIRIGQGLELDRQLEPSHGFLFFSGWLAMLTGDYDQALDLLGRAEDQFRQQGQTARARLAADRRAYCLLLNQAYPAAVLAYQQLAREFDPNPPTWLKANMALALEGVGQFEQSQTLARQALTEASALAAEDQAILLFLLARLALHGHLDQQALTFMEAALVQVDLVRGRITNRELGPYFTGVRGDYEQFYRDLLWQLHQEFPAANYARRAFERSELSRNRTLARITQPDQNSDANGEAMKRAEIQEQLRMAGPETRAQLLRALAEAGTVEEQEPIVEDQGQPNLAEMQSALPQRLVVLSYRLGRERSYLWVITRNSFQMLALAPEAEIANQVDSLLTQLRSPGQASPIQLELLARKLGQDLLPELDLYRDHTLALIKDGILHQLPFAILAPKTELIQTNPLMELPSLYFGIKLIQRSDQGAFSQAIAIFADPIYLPPTSSASLEGSREFRPPVGSFAPLPYTRQEARSILERFSPGESSLFQGEDVTRESFAALDLTRFRLLHFALHGVLDEQYPRFSGLALSMYGPDGEPRDGMLYAYELEQRQIRAELVTLSSCNSARGRDLGVEGLWGISHGFLAGGAARVLVGLWSIEDKATAEFMDLFYQKLVVARLTPARALQQTQLHFRDLKRPAHQWAAFQLQGSWLPMVWPEKAP